jgi:hypothetical protein
LEMIATRACPHNSRARAKNRTFQFTLTGQLSVISPQHMHACVFTILQQECKKPLLNHRAASACSC